MKRSGLIIFCVIILSRVMNSQNTIGNSDFFPHQVGDTWEYYDPNWPGSPLDQNTVIADSIAENGNHYIITSKDGKFILDTNQNLVYHSISVFDDSSSFKLWYKLNADSGQWWICSEDSFGRQSAIVSDVYYGFVWNATPILIKRFDFYFTSNTRDSLLQNTDILALGYGLIEQYFDLSPFRKLRGSLIDGDKHGTITSVKLPNQSLINDFVLFQNYLNPFNPSTIIQYCLLKNENVVLKVYDILGREITTLVNNKQTAGNHTVTFNSNNINSGIYFYILTVRDQSITRKLIVTK